MMNDTTTTAAYRPLGFSAAFLHQLRFLWTSRRPLLMGVGLLALLVLAGDPWVSDPKMRLLTFWPLWLVLIGPLWAFAVFHNEGPSGRQYHWSLPVGRTFHTLARLAAGLAWLWLLFGVLIAAGAALGALDGDLWQLGLIDAMGWANFFAAPLMGYLAVSILTVGSDYPVRWFFGILFLFPLVVSLLIEVMGMEEIVKRILTPLGSEDWGFFAMMVAGLGRSVMRVEHALSDAGARAGAAVPQFGQDWWLATPLWILLLAALVVFLASRHPDTLPRLRSGG